MSGGFRSRSKSGDKPKDKPTQGSGQNRDGNGRGGNGRGGGRNPRGGKKFRGNRDNRDNRGHRQGRGGAGTGSSHRAGRQGGSGQRLNERAQAASLAQAAKQAGLDLPRAVSLETLQRVHQEGAFANLILPRALREQKLSGRDAAFATEIAYGTLRAEGVVDAVIARCSSRELSAIAPAVLDALRMGVYQVLYTRVEDHAAVDTTVRLVEAAGETKAKGFANGIMRSVTRRSREDWINLLAPDDEVARLAFEHAHPEWIARSFARVVGREELPAALAADSERPVVHLVARPGEITAEELALMTGCEQGRYSPYAVYLEHSDPADLEPVKERMAAVQDEGSQLIARAVVEAEVSGEDHGRWLDLCAGPGGKAALMGALARIEGAKVDAVEVSEHRAKLIDRTAGDLPVRVHVADGRDPGLESGYDRVLVDVPCSGLGALRRRPEARWRKEEADLAELSRLQFELLRSGLELLRPGGILIYSTCSPDLRETRAIVDKAVAQLGAVEEDAHALLPEAMTDVGEEKSVQMWPHRHGTDAMFFAALRRNDT